MQNDTNSEKIEAWLKKPKNYKKLINISQKLSKEISRKNIAFTFFDKNISSDSKNYQQELTENILQELVLLIISKESLSKTLLSDDISGLYKIHKSFINHITDIARSKDLWKNFYRHARVILNDSNKVYTFTSKKGTSFCLKEKHSKVEYLILEEDLHALDTPENMEFNYEKINKKNNIIKLAIHFWEQISILTNDSKVKVDLKLFVQWIAIYVDMRSKITKEHNSSEDSNKLDIFESAKDNRIDLEQQIHIPKWAENFKNLMDKEERSIFYYFFCEGLKHKEISNIMNKKSSLSYLRDKTTDKLKMFLRPLPWLSPESSEPFDEKIFTFFKESLCFSLKSNINH